LRVQAGLHFWRLHLHDVVSEPIDPSLPDREDAAKLHRYMVISHDVFLNHPISKARVARFYSDEIAAGYMYYVL